MSLRRVVCDDLTFDWPDGTPVLSGLDLALDDGHTGLVGANGSGKSTLLRLIAGDLRPTSGSLTTSGAVALLRQDLPSAVDTTLSDLLGVTARRAALHAIERGETDPRHFAALGDDWAVEERALATLDRLGLPSDPEALDRRVATLSGGEAVLAGVAGLQLSGAAVSLLDEPTNNLDRPARHRLYDAVEAWPGVLVVVSHDRDLLERAERIVELRESRARTFGGPYSFYEARLTEEQTTAQRLVRAAEAEVRRERRQVVEAQVKLDRRQRYARTAELNRTVPKIVANSLKRKAQVSAGKMRTLQADRLDDARAALSAAEDAVRDDDSIRIDLPSTAVPAGRSVLEVRLHDGAALTIRGPERVALVGRNGSGKTTLLRAVLGQAMAGGTVVERPPVPVGYLPQRLDLEPGRTVLDIVRRAAPAATPHEVRAGLARFLLRGPAVEQTAGSLSGGERFRVALAALLLSDPPPQLLLLDEPTNNLDLASVARLREALSGYRGALVVVSHDERFLLELGITRWWSTDGGLHELAR